jgi:hypothetical protein
LPMSWAFALFFLLLHPAMDRCSCLLCTYRLLGAARKNQSYRLVPRHIHGRQSQLGLHCCPTFSLLLVSSSFFFFCFVLFVLVGLGFELRISCLQSSPSAWATPQSILLWLFWRWGSHELFAWAGLKLWSWSHLPK